MAWTALRWIWRLEAPLFIGMSPAGALNRCRPYVPARVLWGAVTAEASRLISAESFPDYGKLGEEIARNCRFTYLYPTEKSGEEFLAWLPKYEKTKGLHWYRQDGRESLSDRDFRRRLLDSRPGTAITPETDSASEGTLRETECINPWWRASSGWHEEPIPMLFLGYVFLKNNDFFRQLDNIDTLFVGGDTRYGLGKICRVERHDLSGGSSVFGQPVHLNKENPEIQSDIVFGHALEDGQTPIQGMRGMKELLSGWEHGSLWKGALTWAPGSSLEHSADWAIDNYGYWMHPVADNG